MAEQGAEPAAEQAAEPEPAQAEPDVMLEEREQDEVVADLAYDQERHAPLVVVRVLVGSSSQRTAAPTARQPEPQTQLQETT